MIPHEKRIGDQFLTKYFVQTVDGFIAMSDKVKNDIKTFSHKPVSISPHPIFNHFGNPITKKDARTNLGLPNEGKIILFFGYIRKYKGLDLLIQAMADDAIIKLGIRLMIVGEFYEDASAYHELVNSLGLQDQIIFYSNYIPDGEVKNYVCSADFIIQPYKMQHKAGLLP